MKMNKNKAPEVIGQTVESVTTNVFDPKKPEKFQAGKLKKPGFLFDLFSPFKVGIFADDLVKVNYCHYISISYYRSSRQILLHHTAMLQ